MGLTPFRVEGFRLPGTPALPLVSQFPETNPRTYVVDGDGTDGLWFLSPDVAGRLVQVPVEHQPWPVHADTPRAPRRAPFGAAR